MKVFRYIFDGNEGRTGEVYRALAGIGRPNAVHVFGMSGGVVYDVAPGEKLSPEEAGKLSEMGFPPREVGETEYAYAHL